MSNNIRKLREAAGLSATELAKRAGISPQALCNYEHGRRRLSLAAVRIAEVLHCSPHELVRTEI
jgi:transcriptional regulator with XRE-family HTH domain